MRIQRGLYILLMIVFLGVYACNPAATSTEGVTGDQVATMVAAT